ncbi:MAG TPA: hypothetical protein PK543_00080 [Candidatus Saccharibacteria bacterium]|nr:hypothetical protein [Candidatus Saccharibacteria bacterium]
MAQTPEEKAVIKALGDGGKMVVNLVNSKLEPVSDINAWRRVVDEDINRLNARYDEPSSKQATKLAATTKPIDTSPADFRTWGLLQWLLAAVSAIIVFLIFMAAWEGFFPGRPEVLRFIGAFAIISFAFMLGGVWGSFLGNRKR